MTEAVVAESATTHRSRRPLVIGVAVLAAALAASGWWVTHPTRLVGVGDEVDVQAAVGQPVLVGLYSYPKRGSVMLRDARPRIASGGAAARVRVLWCVAPNGGSPVGAARATAQETCAETPSLDGQRLAMPAEDTRFGQLVVEVVPLEAGEVRIDGVDVTYSAGLRRGTQASGVVIKVAAADAK